MLSHGRNHFPEPGTSVVFPPQEVSLIVVPQRPFQTPFLIPTSHSNTSYRGGVYSQGLPIGQLQLPALTWNSGEKDKSKNWANRIIFVCQLHLIHYWIPFCLCFYISVLENLIDKWYIGLHFSKGETFQLFFSGITLHCCFVLWKTTDRSAR